MPYPYGGASRQVQIDLDQNALRAHGLSANDVGDALARQNLITPVGTQKIGAYEFTVDLNDSPKALDEFNNLPIKVVNGAVVFIRDVAYVHDGSPPQTNVVQLDGRKGVLMSVLKIGSASTLDIIAGVKARLPAIQATLPPGVTLRFVGDQSGFVKDSVSSVVREGLIAAALTGLMILVFLGSWRSTLIITVSIPLAVLSSLTALAVLGQTINVMTLGGLALAVGILVDDATVTIENVNRHMEELGEDIVTAITHGAQEIMPPATVSLFCICIAFMPLLALGGVAGYLFRPLAMAVVFAMIASYILTYTLVPTMARFLLRNQHHHSTHAGEADPPGTGFFTHFQHGFESRFERLRHGYMDLLGLALARRFWFVGGFLACALLSLGLAPSLGEDFFPSVEFGGNPHPYARPDRHAHRRDHAAGGRGGTDDPLNHSAKPPRQHRRQPRLADQRHQHLLRKFRHDRRIRRRHPRHPQRRADADGDLCEDPARAIAHGVSRRNLRVPAGRHRQPNPQFRLAGADRRADRGLRSRRQPRFRQQTARQDPPRCRRRGSAHPAGVQVPRHQGRLQPRAGGGRRTDGG